MLRAKKKVSNIVCVTEASLQSVVSFGVDANKHVPTAYHYIPHAIKFDNVLQNPRERKIDYLFVGRKHIQKGFNYF